MLSPIINGKIDKISKASARSWYILTVPFFLLKHGSGNHGKGSMSEGMESGNVLGVIVRSVLRKYMLL